ncbi:DUF6191 domain-containing protein [Streptomyces sp. NPDC057682]|uniref:DUF6191 domain-containing protein n=1 Tax=Streptomyces sp. NPDC057682 TaxID=3346210 RepID=UPI0036C6DFB6
MFNFFEELFAPGRRHTNDERRRLELSRVDLGVGDPARGPIDLSSGKVVVRRRDEDDGDPAEPDDGGDGNGDGGHADGDGDAGGADGDGA